MSDEMAVLRTPPRPPTNSTFRRTASANLRAAIKALKSIGSDEDIGSAALALHCLVRAAAGRKEAEVSTAQ